MPRICVFLTVIPNQNSFILSLLTPFVQAKLPDINQALAKHRDKMQHHMENKEWVLAVISFNSGNALFPEDYSITVNTEEYNKMVQSRRLIQCSFCDEWHEYTDIQPYEIMLSREDRLVLLQKNAIVWECNKCQKTQLLEGSVRKTTKVKEPFYLKVIPEAPAKHGLSDRLGYTAKMHNWCDIAYKEFEHQVSTYRRDYAAQQQETLVPIPDEEADS